MTTKTPEIQDPRKTEDAIRARFVHFRTTYIDKSQRKAAVKLEVAQSVLSKAETGDRPLNYTLLSAFVSKFNMDANWALTGEGAPTKDGKKKTALISDITTFQSQLDTMQKYIKLMEVKHMKLYSKVEELEAKLAEKK